MLGEGEGTHLSNGKFIVVRLHNLFDQDIDVHYRRIIGRPLCRDGELRVRLASEQCPLSLT